MIAAHIEEQLVARRAAFRARGAAGIAVAADLVPDLWESVGDGVAHMTHTGEEAVSTVGVYACWRRKEEGIPPNTYLTLQHGPFSFGLTLKPFQARELAANLVRCAVLAEATQAALDEELQKVS